MDGGIATGQAKETVFYNQEQKTREGGEEQEGGKLRESSWGEGGGLMEQDLQDADKLSRDAEITRLLGNHLGAILNIT